MINDYLNMKTSIPIYKKLFPFLPNYISNREVHLSKSLKKKTSSPVEEDLAILLN